MTDDAHRRPGAAAGGALRHSGFFGYRVPALPMSALTAWSAGVQAPSASGAGLDEALAQDRAILRDRLAEIADRPDVRGALSMASPDLLDALRDRADDPGVEAAFVRYVARMASRPTPYGLFAACGVGVVGDKDHVDVPDPATWRLHTQLDADYLDSVVRDAWRRLGDRLELSPNESLHLMGGRWRYVASRLDGLERSYHLMQVADSKHLQRALAAARPAAELASVAEAVAAGGIEPERAARYAEQLVDAQVLLPSLAVTVTGRPPLDALITDLESLGDDAANTLAAVRDELATVDREGGPAVPAAHDRIAARLAGLGLPVERARLLHGQLTVPAGAATLAPSTVEHIVRGVDLLHRLAPPSPPTELDAFRKAFRERYGLGEVPLLEALDEELGVGFGTEADRPDPVPLLDGLHFPNGRGAETTIGRRELRLVEILHRAWSEGLREVTLGPDDVEALAGDPPPLPAAVAATAVLTRTATGPRVIVTGANGPSGARLLGRFCHSDPELERHVQAHLRAEEQLDPEAVHAEIVHLPSGRLVNVLARPVLRNYELEWLGRSGAPRDRILSASDLLVSLPEDRFVLRSHALGRRVVPRLTSAHNYNRRSPGVYRFLAALQADGCAESVEWSWFPFDRAPFTPRLRRGAVVLALARWRVGSTELRALDEAAPVARWRAVTEWRDRRRLPRWICLVDFDNVLPFDLDNVVSVDAFVRTVRRREEVLLEELFPGPDELVASGPDGPRALEVVVPLVGRAPSPPVARAAERRSFVRRTFPPGSEWTYLKLYTGSATADRLLVDAVAPCTRQLLGAGAADRWFFLRYEDPGFHLRVRAHGDSDRIRMAFETLAARAIDDGLVHDAAFGTYTREIERYGGEGGIEIAERLFHADSEAVVELLGLFDPGEPGLDARWRLGVAGADRLLRDLGLSGQQCVRLARHMHRAFDQEMRAESRLRKEVAAKVRAERAALEELLDSTGESDHALASGVQVLGDRSRRIAPLAPPLAELPAPVESLATSFVHMWLNRLCRSESRRQEYVTYAMLARLYEARASRSSTRR